MEFAIFHDIYLNKYGYENLYWFLYILNLIFSVIAFKLGFARELPLLKSVIVYILLAIGVFVVTFFSYVGYPLTESLIIICAVLGIYRFRLHKERRAKKEASQ